MTPVTVAELARQQLNAIGDSFWSDNELYLHIFNAQMELATKTKCIQEVYTTLTTAGTQEYAKPTSAVSIRRITYNGRVLTPITMRQDDQVTLLNQATTTRGTPTAYFEWGDSIFLRDIPDSSTATLKIFTFDQPQTVSSTSTLDVPSRYHADLADYVAWRMALKAQRMQMAAEFKKQWDGKVLEAVRFERVRLRGDSFTSVNDVDRTSEAFIGPV